MILGVTMGDSSGVGPEIALKAYRDGDVREGFILIGDYSAMDLCNAQLGFGVPLKKIQDISEYRPGRLNVLDLELLKPEQIRAGQISGDSGLAACRYVTCAARLALDGAIGAIVTLPMNKEATRLAVPDFTGHTELIAEICGQSKYTMMLCGDKLTVTHVSTHVPMGEAVRLVKKSRVRDVIRLTHEALLGVCDRPRIAVAGLNPHAGENGSFGAEDAREILPAVQEARAEGIAASGPIPPDTVFFKAVRGQYDAVVCMYHDQGHIPMKLLDFEGGVNVTLGLKIIRTSVDHGTAFDIAYRGVASTQSYIRAFRLAEKMCRARLKKGDRFKICWALNRLC